MSDNPSLVSSGDTITATEENRRTTRVTFRFASAAQRDTELPAPEEGRLCYLEDTDRVQYYDGSTWTDIANIADTQLKVAKVGDTMTGKLLATTAGFTILDADHALRPMFIGAQPAQAVQGSLWIDTLDAIGDNSGAPVLRRWSGSAWTPMVKGRP